MPDRRLRFRPPPMLRCCILLLSATIPLIVSVPRASAAPTAVRLGDGIVRFDADAAARAAAEPYPGFVAQPPMTGPAPADFPVTVDFYRVNRRAAARVAVPAGADLYGTGEVFGPLRRNGTPHRLLEQRRLRLRRRYPAPLPVAPLGAVRAPRRHRLRRARRRPPGARRSISPPTSVSSPTAPRSRVYRDRPRLAAGGREGARRAARPRCRCRRCGRWAITSAATRTRPTTEVREDRRRFPQAAHPLRRDLARHRLHGRVPLLHLRPGRLSRSRSRSPTSCTPRGSTACAIIDPGIKQDRGYAVYDSGDARTPWVQPLDGATYHRPRLAGRLRLPRLHQRRARALVGRPLPRLPRQRASTASGTT